MAVEDDRLERRLKNLSGQNPNGPMFGNRKVRPANSDKRSHDRTPTFRVGKVIYAGRSEIPCVIKDYTQEGARIALEGEIALPEQVVLAIAQAGVRRMSKVIWQDGREVGLEFEAASG
jgi:hypothetical protein